MQNNKKKLNNKKIAELKKLFKVFFTEFSEIDQKVIKYSLYDNYFTQLFDKIDENSLNFNTPAIRDNYIELIDNYIVEITKLVNKKHKQLETNLVKNIKNFEKQL